ncbi:PilZ domain-containing protein [Roseibium sp.]|uniref:PilZ domain-containing protein n=1 Tax=Roseibium sp. TaxID=1936156 RepID=UPI003BA9DB99
MKEIFDRYSGGSNIMVLVLDFETLDCEEAIATDITRSGCRIRDTSHSEKNKLIGLRLSGLDKMVKGKIREILEDDVQVSFLFEDDTKREKRKEKRRTVSIAASVLPGHGMPPVSCQIVDASLSGCRFFCNQLDDLPDTIALRIPGMDLPVGGSIVWRANGYAGVKMNWQFSGKTEFMAAKTIRPPSLAEKAGANGSRKKTLVKQPHIIPAR